MTYLVAVVAFVLFSLSTQIPWKLLATILSGFFLAVSIVFAANTGLYQWLQANAILPILGWLGGWIDASGTQIAGALVVIGAAAIVATMVAKRELTKHATIGLILCGFFVSLAAGPVAAGVTSATDGFERAGQATVARWIGA